jgi:hypothetical protein
MGTIELVGRAGTGFAFSMSPYPWTPSMFDVMATGGQ